MIKRCAKDEAAARSEGVCAAGGTIRACNRRRRLSKQNTKTNEKWGKNKKQRSENIFRPQDGAGGRRGQKSYHREGSRWPANLLLAALYREQFDA